MPGPEDVSTLRGRAAELEAELSRTWKRIGEIERRCHHEWGETTYDPIRRPGQPDTMPTDGSYVSYDDAPYRRGSPPRTEDRWSRRCSRCQKIQYTKASKPSGWVPDFGGD